MKKFLLAYKKILLFSLPVVVVVGVASGVALQHSSIPSNVVTVQERRITQTVNVTGKIKAAENVNLAFEHSGTIRQVNVAVGSTVSAGQVLALLDSSEARASLQEAESAVQAQVAKLEELKAGTRIEDINIKQTQLDKARQDLDNIYQTARNDMHNSYTKADDAVRNQIDALYSNDEDVNPQLTFTVFDNQIKNDAELQRTVARNELNSWKTELAQLDTQDNTLAVETSLTAGLAHLNTIRTFLNKVTEALLKATPLSQSTMSSYRTSIDTARTNVNTAYTTLSADVQSIASQKIELATAQNELRLKQAGATRQEIQAQEAQLREAQARQDSMRVQLGKMALYSPIHGVVSKQDAKVGQIASPNSPLISILSTSKLEVEANVSETDIGKIKVGNHVAITLDAFAGETFSGTIASIDPAETVIDGVVNFKMTALFDTEDARLKSGLTANLAIEAQTTPSALAIPQSAVIHHGEGTYVQRFLHGVFEKTPVTLGLAGSDGFVQVISGLSKGDMIASIGKP